MNNSVSNKRRSLHFLEWLNFFLADVQTGLGPFVAAYLASSGWNPGSVGYALTFGGLTTVAMQTPAGAIVDAVRRKRLLIIVSLCVLVCGAILLMAHPSPLFVYSALFLIGGAAPFLGPTVAAITLGIVGVKLFDRQFGKNQAFNSTGNVFTALLIAYVSYRFGYRAIFIIAGLMAIPAVISVLGIDAKQIDYARARGSKEGETTLKPEGLLALVKDRTLLYFLLAAFLFHLANAAMLPELGEMLSKRNLKAAAAFMSACIIVTQLVIAISAAWIGKRAGAKGRKPLLMLGYGVLPIRGILYTLTHVTWALIAIQTLDGVANAIFGIVSILVIKDLTEGTGRFNLAAGALATMVGIGAALSTTIGGVLIQRISYQASFLSLAAVALAAFALLWLAVPETLPINNSSNPSDAHESPRTGRDSAPVAMSFSGANDMELRTGLRRNNEPLEKPDRSTPGKGLGLNPSGRNL
ncbi:MAG: MFS transporter [Candidatus Acidiferrales bacterium]